MRKSAMIRIICWSFVALLLLGLLVGGLITEFDGHSMFRDRFHDDNHQSYLIGGDAVPAADISKIKVDWVAGSVLIAPHDGDQVEFQEHAYQDLSERDRLHYTLKDGILTIRFSAPKVSYGPSTPKKDLELLLPRGLAESLRELDVESVSATVRAEDISADESFFETVSGALNLTRLQSRKLDIETVSGTVTGDGLNGGKLSLESVSGSASLEGGFEKIDHESISGSVGLALSVCPDELDISTVSGKIAVSIPENNGFTAKYDLVSGQLRCGFPTTSPEKHTAVYKDGGADFKFESVSGNVELSQTKRAS